MNRNELQEAAANRLEKSGRLICQWATGTGKSGVVLKFLRRHPEFNCLILVPEQNNIPNWEFEFDKFGIDRKNVTILCYASYHKVKDTRWNLLVFDEMPHVDTEKRLAVCRSVKGEYILALGAVITYDEQQSLESVYGKFDKSIIGLSQAIKMGILPEPKIYVLHLQLDDTQRNFWLGGRSYTALGYYGELKRRVDAAVSAFENNANKFNKSRMLRAGNERKRFLGEQKEKALKRICLMMEESKKRFLCFCSSIKQAEKLGGEHAFTSKSPKSFNHLDKFNSHEIDSLYVVGKLIEGQNLTDIDCGVIAQLGGTQRITVQEAGRIMRSLNPQIYILVFDDTKDESFLYTLTSSIPAQYIKHYKF